MSILYVGCIKFLTNRFVGNFVLVNVFRVFFFFFFFALKKYFDAGNSLGVFYVFLLFVNVFVLKT